ncbi:TonB-dependent receptor [Thiohalomonas denitrificans]|uniref:TonB-dependent receptor n=1 Tax=Thiohalomonas denitrificans TaxID=415747 RepID=UPI0026EB69B2|nr:TonB-dependent receptor [Thiohalomonas denitrificans]
MHNRKHLPFSLAILALAVHSPYAAGEESAATLDELDVVGESRSPLSADLVSPSTRITDVEVESSINAATVEDFVKYEPSMVVRRRYIGDTNGVAAIRGSNMFQTGRTLVYADGIPLHYLLETRWSGAPRWGLVAADETQAAEVIYGPFSAEYSGNAMGGVVNLETRFPTEREFHAEAGVFSQDFEHMGADDTYTGHREFVSIGDKFDKLSLYFFHNHLENDSQPQKFLSAAAADPTGGETEVSGAFKADNARGTESVFYGDSGSDDVTTDLTKFKLGYDFGDWFAKLTLGYEAVEKDSDPDTYVVDANGDRVWSGDAVFNGDLFTIGSWSGNPFAVSEQERKSLLIGAGLEGPLGTSDWILDANLSRFDITKDETRSSDRNPDDPDYTLDGSVSEYDDTGWTTLDLKARTDRFLDRSDMNMVVGYHYDNYSLEVNSYDSDDYLSGVKTSRTESSGGETRTNALFAQWGWDFAPRWDVALGGRYEEWKALDGFNYDYNGELLDFEDRTETGFSPKLSLGFHPGNLWDFRYSLAKAYRFPMVEELFKNETSTQGTTIADADLEPEVGLHHNLMAERQITRGFLRASLFHEVVEDVIWNQTDLTTDVTTFLPVTEVTTSGLEFVIQQKRVMESEVDVRFNLTYTDSEVTENEPDPGVEGNDFPRMPEWRANMLATYHINPQWNTALGVRYASDSHGDLDNEDNTDEVYGAQDSYLFVDLKANYQISKRAKLSLGVDNVTDDVAFVAHPWAQRTFYLQASVDF